MNRKTFLKKPAGAVIVALPAYALLSCSGYDSANGDPDLDPDQADCLANGANATAISSNHGHTLVVAKADIEAGVEKSYSIKGSSGHSHEIIVSASNFTKLRTKHRSLSNLLPTVRINTRLPFPAHNRYTASIWNFTR